MVDGSAVLLPLWSNIGVMQRGKTWEKDTPLLTATTTTMRHKRASKKRECERLQKIAERIEREGDTTMMMKYSVSCNASLRHLATFRNVIAHARENNEPLGLATFKRRMNDNEVKKVWGLVRRWLSDMVGDTKDIAVVVSIGRTNKGWYFLRCISVGRESNEFIGDLWHYLRKRQWKSKAVVAVAESKELLKYYSREEIDNYIEELFAVFRMSLMVDRRTYKNHRAIEVIESRKIAVNNSESYIVNAPMVGDNSCSGVALCYFESDRGAVVSANPLVG